MQEKLENNFPLTLLLQFKDSFIVIVLNYCKKKIVLVIQEKLLEIRGWSVESLKQFFLAVIQNYNIETVLKSE